MEISPERKESVSSLIRMAELLQSGAMTEHTPIVTEQTESEVSTGMEPVSLTSGARTTRESILRDLAIPVDRFGKIKMSKRQTEKLNRNLRRQTYGSFSVAPMMCKGEECPIRQTCEFFQEGVAPLGESCLIEENLIEYWMTRYLDEFNVDPSSMVEMHLISELVEITLQDSRSTKYLSIYAPMMVEDYVIGVDNMGGEITSRQVSKLFDIKERLKKQKMKILESLVATRERKIKVVTSATTTAAAISISDIKDKLDRLTRTIKNTDQFIIDGEIIE